MTESDMTLTVTLPYCSLFIKLPIRRLVAETTSGSFGFLPHRLDCVAALIPGIIAFLAQDGIERYIAVEEGVLIKTGSEVHIVARTGSVGKSVDDLKQLVENEYKKEIEKERSFSSLEERLEKDLMKQLMGLSHG